MKKFRRVAALLTAFCLAAAAITTSVPGHEVQASSLSSLQTKKAELQKEIDQVQQDLNATKDDLAKQAQYQTSLLQQIELNLKKVDVVKQELALLREKLAEKEQELEQTAQELAEKETEIADTYEKYKQRMRTMYMAGETSTLQMLFEAESFADFLTSIEIMKAITAHDTELLETLEVQKNSIATKKVHVESVRADVQEQYAQTEATQAELEQTRDELQAAYEESTQAMLDIELEKELYEANLAAKKKETEALQAEIDAIFEELARQASNSSNSTMSDSGFIWPVPAHTMITSGFGPRWGTTHKGLDISGGGCYGSDIVASASGTVVKAIWSNYGYGNYLIIDHGGGYTTLYAHCSNLLVSVGQNVAQGQRIAQIGSSGDSTGPHLHFEVRIDGVAQNPRNYV